MSMWLTQFDIFTRRKSLLIPTADFKWPGDTLCCILSISGLKENLHRMYVHEHKKKQESHWVIFFHFNSINEFSLNSVSFYSPASLLVQKRKEKIEKKSQHKLYESFFNHAKDITFNLRLKIKCYVWNSILFNFWVLRSNKNKISKEN